MASKHTFTRKRRKSRVTTRRMQTILVVAVVSLLLFVGIAAEARLRCEGCADGADITVITTAKTDKETSTAIDAGPADMIRAVAETDGQLHLIKVAGDGSTTVTPTDLTPRDSKGKELKPLQRRQDAISATIADLERTMNEFTATTPGRSALAGLQAVPAGGLGPILVYSPLLDTHDPLSMISLGFDVDPESVVEQLKAANELPAHLKGRDIVFVVTPVAGEQAAPRQPQVMYVQHLMTAIVRAADGGKVTFIVGQGGLPAGTSGDAPVVPIPGPPDTIKPNRKTTRNPDGTTMVTTQCVIPSPQFFEPNRDILLDEKGAKTALANCVRHATATTTVTVEGHTACRNAPDSDPAYAKTLSENRARRIVDIVVALGVPRHNTTTRGLGASAPLVKPCSDPANRATVVTITTLKESK